MWALGQTGVTRKSCGITERKTKVSRILRREGLFYNVSVFNPGNT